MVTKKGTSNVCKQAEEVNEFIMLLNQMSDDDKMLLKGMMMWATGESKKSA